MASLLDSALSVLSGGATGIIGTGLTMAGTYFDKKQQLELDKLKYNHVENMFDKENAVKVKELASADHKVDMETDAAKEISADSLMGKSYNLQFGAPISERGLGPKMRSWRGFVDGLSSFIRPFLALYSTFFLTYMYYSTLTLLGGLEGALTKGDLLELFSRVVNMILYLSCTYGTWWFGVRGPGKRIFFGKDA